MTAYDWLGGNLGVAASWVQASLPVPPVPPVVPGAADLAYFGVGPGPAGGALAGNLNVLSAFFYAGPYTMAAGAITVGVNEEIGLSPGATTFTQTGGNHTVGSNLQVGEVAGAFGVYVLNNGVLSTGLEHIGQNTSGTFVQMGGNHTVSDRIVIGTVLSTQPAPVGNGLYTLGGTGVLTVQTIFDGSEPGCSGIFNFNTAPADAGQLNISGTGGFPGLIVGGQGTGTFNHGAGALNTTLDVGRLTGGVGTYNFNGGALTSTAETIGDQGMGTFLHNVGNNTINGALIIGNVAGGNGIYTQIGGMLNVPAGSITLGMAPNATGTFNLNTGVIMAQSQVITVGDAGTGTFNHALGAVTADLVLGSQVGGDGTYNFAAGSLTSDGQTVGDAGTGTFVQNGGVNTITTNGLAVGNSNGGAGTYDLNTGSLAIQAGDLVLAGGGSSTATFNFAGGAATLTLGTGVIQVGYHGNGTFNQLGGSIAAKVIVGSQTGGQGTYELNQGTLTSFGQTVGNNGTGTFRQDGGSNSISGGDLLLGALSLGLGNYKLNTGVLTAAGELIGNDGLGSFVQAAGQNIVTGGSVVVVVVNGPTSVVNGGTTAVFAVGTQSDGTGYYEIDGGALTAGGSTIAGQEIIGYAGKGSFLQKGGTNTITGANSNAEAVLLIGELGSGTGTYELDTGALLAGTTGMIGQEIVGDSGKGTFLQKGGGNTITGDGLRIGVQSTGVYTLTGGTLSVTSTKPNTGIALGGSIGGAGTLTVNSGTVSTPVLTIGGAGTGNVTAGNGGSIGVATMLQLATGSALHVNGGVVLVGAGPASGGAGVQVASGATLTGAGLLDSSLSIAGGANVAAMGGSLHITGAITGSGAIAIGAGASLEIGGGDAAAVAFAASTGSLVLDAPAQFGGVIDGFALGDSIVLSGITNVASVTLGAGNTLTIRESGTTTLNLQLDPRQNFAGENFQFATVGAQTNVTLSSTIATAITNAYTAILRVQPDGSLVSQTLAQVQAGQTTLAQYETGLIASEQAIFTTLPALVTIDAFYGATPSSATLTAVAASTGSPSQIGGFYSAEYLHSLGYSDPNVWTIMASQWGADQTSAFYQQYNSFGSNYSGFISAVYQREFGFAPSAANLQTLLGDVPGVQTLLAGGGGAATPIQVVAGIYGYLLYIGQTTPSLTTQYGTAANAFLQAAANGTVNYGQELTQQFPAGSSHASPMPAAMADPSIITVTSPDQLIDPGTGNFTIQFQAGASGDTLMLHTGGVDQVSGFDPGTDVLDVSALLGESKINLNGEVTALSSYLTIVDQGADALVRFDPTGQGGGATVAALQGLGSSVTGLNTLLAQGAIRTT